MSRGVPAGIRLAIALISVLLLGSLHDMLRASAHPLDQLTQHLSVQLGGGEARVTVAIGGGILANEAVIAQLDHDGNGQASPSEQAAWLKRFLGTLAVGIDGRPVAISAGSVDLAIPPLEDFHIGVAPLLLSFALPLPGDSAPGEHLLSVRNDYLRDRTVHRLDVSAAAGAEVIDASWPAARVRIAFATGPFLPGDAVNDTTGGWSSGEVIAKARSLFTRERTPTFVFAFLGIFALMGALHAIQPGHGKTLVAAYLVATGGTPRHAFALAGIVTFTHTVSVYALGLATVAASQLFLPSKVIPVLGTLSGLLVAAMGLAMLRGALIRLRSSRNHPHGHDHLHPHTHDHAHLTDEEHARLHLEEVLAVRRRFSRRGLVALGVSGGLVPCPDALAILLLAVGLNRAGLGLLAIVAFSLGLAVALVAFGLSVALIGPAWRRARRGAMLTAPVSHAMGRFAAAAPLASAAIVLLLGLAMAWRSLPLG